MVGVGRISELFPPRQVVEEGEADEDDEQDSGDGRNVQTWRHNCTVTSSQHGVKAASRQRQSIENNGWWGSRRSAGTRRVLPVMERLGSGGSGSLCSQKEALEIRAPVVRCPMIVDGMMG